MSPRTRRVVWIALALAGLQALAVVAYLKRGDKATTPSAFRFEPLDPRTAPPLEMETPSGASALIGGANDKVTLVHFWATWCNPCRHELPGLLARAAALDGHLKLVAVAVDDTWPDIRAFFANGQIPAPVVRAESVRARRWGADVLPDTYLLDREGRVIGRYLGARDWGSRAAEKHLNEVINAPSR